MSATAKVQRSVREVSREVPEMLLKYLTHALDPAGLVQLADMLEIPCEGMERSPRWERFDDVVRLFEAASVLTGDLQLGRRSGEECFWDGTESSIEVLLSIPSVGLAVKGLVEYGTRIAPTRPLKITSYGDDHCVISATYLTPAFGHKVFCDFTAGYYTQLPLIFGKLASVVETRCQLDGAPSCLYRVAWRPDPSMRRDVPDPAEGPARAAEEIRRFEALQEMASSFVEARDVSEVLQRILDQVSTALLAPRYLLVTQLDDRQPRQVHSYGFSEDRAEAYADRILAGELSEADGVLDVEIGSEGKVLGHLVAFFTTNGTIHERDRRVLKAYARHATAALEVIASLDGARRDRDLAKALLHLARDLAEVGTSEDICARLVRAVPAVTGAEMGTVWRISESGDQLVLAGSVVTTSSDRPLPDRIDMSEMPRLKRAIERPKAIFLDASKVPASLAAAFRERNVAAAVPIVSKGTLFGIVTAGFRSDPSEAERVDILERLTGLADHAATALENAQLLERMQHETLHDRLTGLANRPLVEDRSKLAFAMAARSGKSVGLLFVDLDRFKIVNDTLGHAAGDDLICQVADRMVDCMRTTDTLARLGGDEFVVLLPEISGVDIAVEVADRLIRALERPFMVLGHELFISCSVGVACSPGDGLDYQTLMLHADGAMYAAKANGRNAFAVQAPSVQEPRRQQLDLESQLHKAVENDELRVLYQPQIDLTTMRMVGVEALVRWQHPTLGMLAPDKFLPLAEESGMIVPIDAWVRRTAFRQAAAWSAAGNPLRVAVNLSTRDLANPDLPELVRREMAHAEVSPSLVELEITDRAVLSEEDLPIVIDSLHALGVRLAIDDFGTGTSVLGRLHSSPVDTLKIDRSFVQAMAEDAPEAPLVRAIITLAHSLNLDVVAEGVETIAQGRVLRRYGCEMAQGFLFSRPVSPDQIDVLCEDLPQLPA